MDWGKEKAVLHSVKKDRFWVGEKTAYGLEQNLGTVAQYQGKNTVLRLEKLIFGLSLGKEPVLNRKKSVLCWERTGFETEKPTSIYNSFQIRHIAM